MRKNSIFIGISIFCLVTSYAISDRVVLAGGGNPEVKNISQCFKLEKKERINCFNKYYPEDVNITTYPPYRERIILAGRKSSIEKREFNLEGQEKFVIYLDISNVKLPISWNIKTAELLNEKGDLVVEIEVKDIKSKVTLQDKDGKVILDYTVVK